VLEPRPNIATIKIHWFVCNYRYSVIHIYMVCMIDNKGKGTRNEEQRMGQ